MGLELENTRDLYGFILIEILNSLGVYVKVPYRIAVTIRNSVPTTNST